MSRQGRRLLISLIAVWTVLAVGCASSNYLQVRRAPRNPLNRQLQLLSRKGPSSTDRTQRLLRRYALLQPAKMDQLTALSAELASEPTSEKAYAYAELSYIRGKEAEAEGQEATALEYYGGSVMHSFMYLFDPRFDFERNPYDPQYRGACDLYNGALEAALRIVNRQQKLKPGTEETIQIGERTVGLHVIVNGPWHQEEFERFEFVSDFELKGLNNRHHHYGLGVPLIAVRRNHANEAAYEEHYPPGLAFPVTAFLRMRPGQAGEPHRICTIELHDALTTHDAHVGELVVPLETDLSTALAYSLDRPEFRERQQLATAGFLNPNKTGTAQGLYMLEPYDASKIPVLMVHGLWSDPLTWMEMFNDLRSFPEIRERYQFWFYLYPTGQPFWVSASRMRTDLEGLHRKLDPYGRNRLLNQMVLVGHSMGGLVSRMQIVSSENDFWTLVSDKPFEEIELGVDEREQLARSLFFHPNPSVKRVVSIGTPYRGSNFANDYTRWLSRKLISAPKRLLAAQKRLMRFDELRKSPLLSITTSIDSLAPESPILPVLLEAPTAPWVAVHNIVGVVDEDGFIGKFAGEGDGVVDYASAHIEEAQSELVVRADHTTIHQHPRAILEVRRILMAHLAEADRQTRRQAPRQQSPAPIIAPPVAAGIDNHAAPAPFIQPSSGGEIVPLPPVE